MAEEYAHRPVLLEEALTALAVREDGVYVDTTFGRGGHARALLQRLGPEGRLLIMDRDPEAVRLGRALAEEDDRVSMEQGNFTALAQRVAAHGWTGRVDGILADLGVSSPQLEDPARGFSFRHDGPLDMRMDPEAGPSAAEWLERTGEGEIARVLKEYGEERHARRVARAIVRRREAGEPVQTTGELAELVRANVPAPKKPRGKGGRKGEGARVEKDPATRAFQALRIAVNGELEALDAFLEQTPEVLAPGGRLAVISFHSLEDRRVKRFIRREARGDDFPPDLPVTAEQLQPRMRALGRAIRAGEQELAVNPRARSAVLRVAERL
ncbi:MAG TPA: 16S rRNA (cytosine(1402)-N(4))-methyltransferase RsmH [Gammaproteobacteria bacterium]|nr:16S rRNA (cytosine(1402)-N(4))-methyltransferase RsmH [Gammaproteobacteria bacterium]